MPGKAERQVSGDGGNVRASRAMALAASWSARSLVFRQRLHLAGVSQHTGDETEQFIERVKSRGLIRGDMLDSAFETASFDVSLGPKLNNEGQLLLPSVH